jgi:seryl-tRNA synthetase
MLDIRLIRETPDEVREGFRKLGATVDLDGVIALDEAVRKLTTEAETIKAEQNRLKITKDTPPDERERIKAQGTALKARFESVEKERAEREVERDAKLLELPNLPHPSVPVGKDDSENKVVREEGTKRGFEFTPQPHWDLGPKWGVIDFDRGVKVSGSRFYMLKDWGARLQRALITFMLDLHTEKHGYGEVLPPYMVRRESLVGTGNLPKFGDNLYRDAEEDFWFIPTAEVPVTNLYREEILDGATLPIKHVAYTACFRREQLSAGRDVRGIKRGYQFDKVEMVKFVEPETSTAELMSLIDNAEAICKGLGIPYRLLQLCTADLGVATMKYDLEMWAPGVQEWLEVSSCANFGDYQARRANIRYRQAAGAKPEFVHTLNGSGLALPRVLIAIMENYQQADGSIVVPEVLRPYMGGVDVIR